MKSSGQLSSCKTGALWPPLRQAGPPPPGALDPRRLVRCGRLHAALLAVLHRAAHRRRPPPEHLLALALYLLEAAADLELEEGTQVIFNIITNRNSPSEK